jgi:hypothetical protein
MNDSSTIHQVTYIISIRSEYQQLGSPLFRGTLEIVTGQKFEFGTLAELNGLLCEIGGWIDTPPCAKDASNEFMCTENGGERKT